MELAIHVCLFFYYIMGKNLASGLNPILDKTEIGEGEHFSVTCDVTRVTDTKFNAIRVLDIYRKFELDDRYYRMSSIYYTRRCTPPCIEGKIVSPWQAIIKAPKTPHGIEEVQIKLINTNSTCNDAGQYECSFQCGYNTDIFEEKAFLRKKASCALVSTTTTTTSTTSTSELPTETTFSRVNKSDPSTTYTDPTTQGAGFKWESRRKNLVFAVILHLCVLFLVETQF